MDLAQVKLKHWLAQHSHRSLFIKFLQISRLWSPQTCHFLQRCPSMTTQLGRKYLMKWRRSVSPASLTSYLERERQRMLHAETVRTGGLILTEVGVGGAGVLPPLYRGYLDLRSALEITALHWSVQWHAHHSDHNRNNNNQTEISSRYYRLPLLNKCHPVWPPCFPLPDPRPAGDLNLLNKQRSWWPLLNSKELSETYLRYKALCNSIITIYIYILIQWEIWCDASIWLLMVVHSSEVSPDFPRWTDCPLHW